ncbi:MAG: hypothetical protein RR033_05580 [Clostridia bacterium]
MKLNLKDKIKNLNEKDKIVIKNTGMAFLVKGLALLISLVATPAYIKYFNNQVVLGLWYTMLAVLTWVMNFDLGIGNGLRNSLVGFLEREDHEGVKKSISSAYGSIGILTLIISAVCLIIIPFINWNSFFNIQIEMVTTKTMVLTMAISLVGLMAQFFLKTTNSILYALQKSSVNNVLGLLSSGFMLIFVVVFPNTNNNEYNLIALAIANAIISNIFTIGATLWIFIKPLRFAVPNVKFFDKNVAKGILKIGGVFLYCQILYMLIMNTNEIFISKLLSPNLVVDYQIYNKLFSLAGTLFSLALTPVWSAVTKALTQNDFIWIKKSLKVIRLLSVIAIFAEFIIVPMLPFVMKIWLKGNAIEVNYIYASIFAVFGAVFIYQTALSTIVCGLGKMKLQAVSYTIGFIIRILIIIVGVKIFNSWIVVVVANVFIFLPYIVIQDIYLSRYLNKNIQFELTKASAID